VAASMWLRGWSLVSQEAGRRGAGSVLVFTENMPMFYSIEKVIVKPILIVLRIYA